MFALGLAVASLGVVAPAEADTPNCVTWDEFTDAKPGDTRFDGWRRDRVNDHFDVQPYVTTTAESPYDSRDFFRPAQSCSGNDEYSMFYHIVDLGPALPLYHNLGKKCHQDGPGGNPDQCWT